MSEQHPGTPKITLFAAKDDNLHARFAGETRFDPTDQRFSGLRSNSQPPLSALSTSTQAWPCPVAGRDTTLWIEITTMSKQQRALGTGFTWLHHCLLTAALRKHKPSARFQPCEGKNAGSGISTRIHFRVLVRSCRVAQGAQPGSVTIQVGWEAERRGRLKRGYMHNHG